MMSRLRSWWGARRWTSLLALVDQSVYSGANFLTTVVLGRLCGAAVVLLVLELVALTLRWAAFLRMTRHAAVAAGAEGPGTLKLSPLSDSALP